MATTNALLFRLLRLTSAAVLAASALAVGARAQSGRAAPPPTPTPSPTPQPTPVFVPAPGEDRYTVIYTPGWDGPLHPDENNEHTVRHSRLNHFIAQLNAAGARGYRLHSVVNGWLPVAVAELDTVQYEYGWFESSVVTRASHPRDIQRVYTRFFNLYAKQAAGGFRLAEHLVTQRGCARFRTGRFKVEVLCIYKDLYLLERRKGVERPRQTHVAVGDPEERAGRLDEEMTAKVKEGLAEGLRPVTAFSRFAVLLEEDWDAREPSDGAADFRVVTPETASNDDMEKAVNKLARQGYRLHLSGRAVALMRRGAGVATPAEYLWLDAKDKKFEKRLAEALESGAVYRTTYPDDDRDESQLVFERGAADGRRRDYKVFRVDLQFVEDVAGKKVAAGLAPQTREALKTVESLLKDGYVIRDLFWSDAPHLLLERAR